MAVDTPGSPILAIAEVSLAAVNLGIIGNKFGCC